MSEEVNGRYWVRKRVIWIKKNHISFALCLCDELGGGDAIKDGNVSVFWDRWELDFEIYFSFLRKE